MKSFMFLSVVYLSYLVFVFGGFIDMENVFDEDFDINEIKNCNCV